MSWIDSLDPKAALITLHYEMLGDWYRDPWGWPELDWAVRPGREYLLTERLKSLGVRRAAKIDVPKENFAMRPAIVMDPLDRLAYQSLVDIQSKKLLGNLRNFVYGWRLVPKNPRPHEWAHNDRQYERFREHLTAASGPTECALRSDVVSYFASVDIDRVCELIGLRCGGGEVTRRLIDMVRGWDSIAGRAGLAQRSAASASLANLYLELIDEILASHRFPSKGARSIRRDVPDGLALRWMDDLWLFGNDAGKLRAAQLELQEGLRSIGLEMNYGKTALLEGEHMQDEVNLVQHSAIESHLMLGPLLGLPPDPDPLYELVDKLLTDPPNADRTSMKFATKRMRQYELFDRVTALKSNAEQMPHTADSLARLFRDSGEASGMSRWYLKYSKSPWGCAQWAVAQYGTMFRGARGNRTVMNFFVDCLAPSNQLPLVALAAQRLSAWEKDDARVVLREAAKNSSDPHHRRVLALAGVSCGEQPATTRRILNEFEENRVTLEMLKDGIRPKVVADFDSPRAA
jgi:hypothetical protein